MGFNSGFKGLKEVPGMASFASKETLHTQNTLFVLCWSSASETEDTMSRMMFFNRFQREYYCYNTRYPLPRSTNKNHPSSNLTVIDRCLSFGHSKHFVNTPQNCLLCEPLYWNTLLERAWIFGFRKTWAQ